MYPYAGAPAAWASAGSSVSRRLGGRWVSPLMLRGRSQSYAYARRRPNSRNLDALLWPGRYVGANRLDESGVAGVVRVRRTYLEDPLGLPAMRSTTFST